MNDQKLKDDAIRMLSWDELQKNVAIGKKPGEVLGVEVDYTR